MVRVGLHSYIVSFSLNSYIRLSLPVPRQHGYGVEMTVNPGKFGGKCMGLGVRYSVLALLLTACLDKLN